MHRKLKHKVILAVLAGILLMYPFPTENHGYQAALWGFERERVILEEDVRGIAGLTRYYNNSRIRILCFFVTVEHPEDVRTGQW